MPEGPDIARIGALIGDPTRINILSALMGGQALTAGELAREAGVTPQTASSHLAQLAGGGLIRPRRQGRCVYYALAGHEVADLMEALDGLASNGPLENLFHRVSQPEDVAAAILFLSLPGSRQITGQTIHTSAGAVV